MQQVHVVPDFECYFQSAKLSDLEIEVCEEVAEVGEKRKRGLVLPAHSMVVAAFSSYCKVKLDNWTSDTAVDAEDTSADGGSKLVTYVKHNIELPVPPGQTDIAVRLVKGMYQKVPNLSNLSHEQLLQLLMLADRFGVPKVQAAVLEVFKDVPEDQVSWDTAIALLDLPVSCQAQPGYQQAVDTAEKKLLQQLGDLEMVWADDQLQDKLLNLPHAALLRLVLHDKTRVASESTVVYTILQWWEKQQQSYQDSNVQQLKELMQQVRMCHLSQLYISTFMMSSETVLLCYSMHELAMACICTDPANKKALQSVDLPELKQYPAWSAKMRPASSRQQMIAWDIPLMELQDAVTSTLSSKQLVRICSAPHVLQGRTFRLELYSEVKAQVSSSASAAAAPDLSSKSVNLQLGLYIKVANPLPGAVSSFKTQFIVAATSPYHPVCDLSPAPFSRGYKGLSARRRGYANVFGLGSIGSWSDVETKLRQKFLVHEDGCLHITAQILELA